jgi:hypothetical protein
MKNPLILFISFISLTVINVKAQHCDCNIFPVRQQCKNICGIQLLQTGSKEQLKTTLKLEDETAQKIVNLPHRTSKTSVKAFKNVLSPKSYKDLTSKLNTWIRTRVITTAADVKVQPASQASVFDAISLEKGFKYLITIDGSILPDYSQHTWGCNENTINRNFDCSIGLLDVFGNIAIGNAQALDIYHCDGSQIPDFKNNCSGAQQFQKSFTLQRLTQNVVCNLYFKNDDSKTTYHHTCGVGNPAGGFTFPVVIMKGAVLSITKVN